MLGEIEFTLDIRPTFVDELDKAAAYIEWKFKDFLAADRLIADAYDAIDRRLTAPTSFKPCYLPPLVDQPYYRIFPVSDKSGFMILQPGDAKVPEGGRRIVHHEPWYTPTVED